MPARGRLPQSTLFRRLPDIFAAHSLAHCIPDSTFPLASAVTTSSYSNGPPLLDRQWLLLAASATSAASAVAAASHWRPVAARI